MTKGIINILHLYPNEMNIYGDWGNALTLKRRLKWHGYEPKIIQHHPGGIFPKEVDLIVGGGGQDSGQSLVESDLLKNREIIKDKAEDDVPMLMICGLYQLFGRFFKTTDDKYIEGIGLFGMETFGSDKRMVGNVVVETAFGDLVGYENHSGKSVLDANQSALGIVKQGDGNNGEDKTEGAVYRNVYGTYLHGSLLPKNPRLADYLIQKAVERCHGGFEPEVIDDSIADKAREIAASRPR